MSSYDLPMLGLVLSIGLLAINSSIIDIVSKLDTIAEILKKK
jgi:hypothetical protein